MRFKTTAFLAFLLAVIAVLIYVYGGDEVQPDTRQVRLFPGFVPSAVEKLEISMHKGQKAVLERRSGGRWVVTEPYADEARIIQVDKIMDALENNFRVLVPLLEHEMNLPSKGLAPPKHTLTFTDSAGSHTLRMGSRDPFQNEVYVQVDEDERLYRTGSNLLNIVDINPAELRDTRLFRIDPLLVNEVLIEGPEGMVLHGSKSTGIWEILAPVRTDSNSGRFQNMVARLTGLTVEPRQVGEPLPPEELSQYGFDPGYRLTLKAGTLSRSIRMELQGHGPSGDYYCLREREEMLLSVDAVEMGRISFDLNTYRSKEILKPVRERLFKLLIWRGEQLSLELERMIDGVHYQINEPFEALADNVSDGNQTPIYGYLTRVDGIRIQDFVEDQVEDLSAYGLRPPALILELHWKETGYAKKARLFFSEDKGAGTVYGARLDRPGPASVFTVKTEDLAPLYQDALTLRDRRIFLFPLEVDQVERAVFSRKGVERTLLRENDRFVEDDGGSRLGTFLHTMRREQVIRFETGDAAQDEARFETLEGRITYQVGDNQGPIQWIEVDLGVQGPEGWYGRSSLYPGARFLLKDDFMKSFADLF